MILLFLGSWRSTLIVCVSIPLSILTSLCLMSLLGQTINVMTLGGSHRPDDPAVSRKLAQYVDRVRLDSAFHPHVAVPDEPARTNHQRDDARRAGAGGGHSGRRCHGRDRKYTSQPGDGEAPGHRGAGRRLADRGAYFRGDSLDLHRVRSGSALDRNGAIPVYAIGDGRRSEE